MPVLKNRQTGEDLFQAVSQRTIDLGTLLATMAPVLELTLAADSFRNAQYAFNAFLEAWQAALVAEWRATVAAGEHAEARAVGNGDVVLAH